MEISRWDDVPEYWAHWGFEPWNQGHLRGVRRKVIMRKGGLLGDVARYAVWDHILWGHRGRESAEEILREASPLPEVMTQRYVLVGDEEDPFRLRSFWWRFRGFVEVLCYRPRGRGQRKFADLTGLVDALEGYVIRRKGEVTGTKGDGTESDGVGVS